MKKVLGVRALNFVAVLAFETVLVDGVDVEVITLELVVLLIMINLVGDELLVVVAALVDGVLGEFRLHNFESALMPAAVAILAEAFVVVFEINVC